MIDIIILLKRADGPMNKNLNKKLPILFKAQFLIRLINNEDVDALMSDLSAFQLKELRNFLENQLLFLSSHNGDLLDKDRIKSSYPSVHDYFYTYDCREELDGCYNETCLDLNPNCFSRKMKEQMEVLLKMLAPYFVVENKKELEYEKVQSHP